MNRAYGWFILVAGIFAMWLAACGAATTSTTPTAAPVAKALQPGDVAPDFTLVDSKGTSVHLAEELKTNQAVVLVFYQGAG
jgi:cytochrome oxidase Cu insertion factor (SCO1/SenC/PrrC family)